jgi:transposase
VAAVEQAGARVLPLPPSSPDLTPIEEMFSKGVDSRKVAVSLGSR